MFTGLIEEVGTVRSVAVDGERARLVIDATLVTKDNAKDFYFPNSPF